MLFLSTLIQKFKGPGQPEDSYKQYGWCDFNHLKPGSMNVNEIGLYDADNLHLMLKRFIEQSPSDLECIRISTYPCPDMNSPYLMVQDAATETPSKWFCLCPVEFS